MMSCPDSSREMFTVFVFFIFFPCVFLKEIFFFFFLFLNFMHSSIMIFLNVGKALKKINLNIMLRIWPFSSFSCQMLQYGKGYTGLLSWTGHQLCTVPQGISIWIDTVINMITWTVILAFHYSVKRNDRRWHHCCSIQLSNLSSHIFVYHSTFLWTCLPLSLLPLVPIGLPAFISLTVCAAWLVCPMCWCTSQTARLVCGCTSWSVSHCATFGLFST